MVRFIWDRDKELINIIKHGVDFKTAQIAFQDPKRKIYTDWKHAFQEERYICVAEVEGRILTVRFTHREGKIRIFGAGFWRKGKVYYEKED